MPWFFAALRSASFTNVIAQISGALAQKIPGEVIVDVGGVGYQIFIPLNVFYRLPEIGAPVHLQIYTHVREDALQCFCFSSASLESDRSSQSISCPVSLPKNWRVRCARVTTRVCSAFPASAASSRN